MVIDNAMFLAYWQTDPSKSPIQGNDPRKQLHRILLRIDRSPLKHEHEWEIVDERGLRGTKIIIPWSELVERSTVGKIISSSLNGGRLSHATDKRLTAL